MKRTEGTAVLAVRVQYFRNELVLVRPYEGTDISGDGVLCLLYTSDAADE